MKCDNVRELRKSSLFETLASSQVADIYVNNWYDDIYQQFLVWKETVLHCYNITCAFNYLKPLSKYF